MELSRGRGTGGPVFVDFYFDSGEVAVGAGDIIDFNAEASQGQHFIIFFHGNHYNFIPKLPQPLIFLSFPISIPIIPPSLCIRRSAQLLCQRIYKKVVTIINYDDLRSYNSFLLMSERSKLTHMRLLKEEASLGREPIPNALVTRDGFLNFHFCLHDLDGPYSGGLYHGLFQLHENYPFNAPKLYLYTPSGRFETNLPICTSFTNYHQQTWTSAWNVRSLVLATISFMYSEEPSYGCKSDSEEMRAGYAKDSKRFNFQMIADFDRLFGDKLVKLGKITPEERAQLLGKGKPEKSERSEDREDSEQSVQLEEGERERAEAPMEPLVINEEEQNRQEGNLIPAIKLNQQPLLRKKDPDNNNRRNQFRWSIVKAGVVVVVLVGAYLGYRYFA